MSVKKYVKWYLGLTFVTVEVSPIRKINLPQVIFINVRRRTTWFVVYYKGFEHDEYVRFPVSSPPETSLDWGVCPQRPNMTNSWSYVRVSYRFNIHESYKYNLVDEFYLINHNVILSVIPFCPYFFLWIPSSLPSSLLSSFYLLFSYLSLTFPLTFSFYLPFPFFPFSFFSYLPFLQIICMKLIKNHEKDTLPIWWILKVWFIPEYTQDIKVVLEIQGGGLYWNLMSSTLELLRLPSIILGIDSHLKIQITTKFF